ncbi:hypothetical protein NDU88_000330 [Pleurodeles waltl]|uniref:Uncharacterized protein n=1 Tax=Pleurodeles waltl TaxID=8319 RepID=A0AAV7L665_PLEWA|nr:hypothetical protein NDU88_000330 [Pleurodeles waltl]
MQKKGGVDETPRSLGPRGMSEQETECGVEEGKTKTPTAATTSEEDPSQEQFICHSASHVPGGTWLSQGKRR